MRTPTATRNYEGLVAGLVRSRWRSAPLDEPLCLTLEAVFTRKKSAPKSVSDRQAKSTKPDLDNVVKAVTDGLEAGGLVVNDSRFCRVVATKEWAAKGEQPHVKVIVTRWDCPPSGGE